LGGLAFNWAWLERGAWLLIIKGLVGRVCHRRHNWLKLKGLLGKKVGPFWVGIGNCLAEKGFEKGKFSRGV